MDDRYIPPKARIDEATVQELGWSTFSHSRRVGIVANAFALAIQCAILADVVGTGRYFVTILVIDGPYLLGGILGILSLWPYRHRALLAVASILVYVLLLAVGVVAMLFYLVPPIMEHTPLPQMAPGRFAFFLTVMILLPAVALAANAIAWKRARKRGARDAER
jgi:hypothetical protein